MTAEDMIKIMKEARALGCVSLKLEAFEVQFKDTYFNVATTGLSQTVQPHAVSQWSIGAQNLQSAPNFTVTTQTVAQASPSTVNHMVDDLTDEELKYAATPYFEELMAKKAAHKQKLKDEELLRG